jgi:hypothetical protein
MGLFNRNRGQSTAGLEAEYASAPRTVTLTKGTGPAVVRPNHMGGTYLGYPLQMVLDMAKTADSPLYVVIVTDDDPTDEHDVIRLLKELKRYAVFLKVLTLVKAPFWDRMDDLTVPGLIDNLDAKRIKDPAGMSDLAFTDAMVDEWSSWVELATRAGILQ